MKRFFPFLFAALLMIPSASQAQDKPEPYVDAALVSHYMWRGQDLGNVCFQPEIGVRWKGLDFNIEGCTGFTRYEYEELDVNLTYTLKGFMIGLSDMWAENTSDDERYFSYGWEKGHQLEGLLGYECKYGSLTWRTIFAGNDQKLNGKRAYSTFIELAVPFLFYDLDWDFRVGLCPFESAGYINIYEETEYYYAKSFGINMVSLRATKNFPLGKGFKLPVFVEIHTNPAAQNARLLMGVSLATL